MCPPLRQLNLNMHVTLPRHVLPTHLAQIATIEVIMQIMSQKCHML
jgi:hypothetical protein